MDNYIYCAEFGYRLVADKTGEACVLDFGCGAGEIIKLLRQAGVAAFGCDAFYAGGAYPIPDELSGVILPMNGDVIPFPTGMFL